MAQLLPAWEGGNASLPRGLAFRRGCGELAHTAAWTRRLLVLARLALSQQALGILRKRLTLAARRAGSCFWASHLLCDFRQITCLSGLLSDQL